MALTKEHRESIELLCNNWPYLNGLDFEDIAGNFINGDCYVFAKSVQIIIPEAKMRFNRKEAHIAVELDGMVFDAIKRHDNQYGEVFIPIVDDEFCVYNFGYNSDFPQDNVLKIFFWIKNFYSKNLSLVDVSGIKSRLNDYLDMCKNLNIDEADWNKDVMFCKDNL